MSAPGEARKPVVLVVDDEAPVRWLLSGALPMHGFEVLVAASGEEALEIYRRQGREIDVVLMDLSLSGMNGPRTLTALRALDPDVCCCFLTGSLADYSEAELRALGAARVLTKPFTLAETARVLRELVALPRP